MKRAAGWLLLGLACASTPPETHYYQLVVLAPRRAPPTTAGVALSIEPLTVDAAYATDRIVYRKSLYRLDYYHYHRWSASLPAQLGDYLREAYARTGRFARVTLAPEDAEGVTLRGRLLALEEVDRSAEHWVGRVGLELALYDAERQLLWSQTYVEEEPLERQTPEGLAGALSVALQRIVQQSAEPIARAAMTARVP